MKRALGLSDELRRGTTPSSTTGIASTHTLTATPFSAHSPAQRSRRTRGVGARTRFDRGWMRTVSLTMVAGSVSHE